MVAILSLRRIKLLYNKFHHTQSNRMVHLLTVDFLAADKLNKLTSLFSFTFVSVELYYFVTQYQGYFSFKTRFS